MKAKPKFRVGDKVRAITCDNAEGIITDILPTKSGEIDYYVESKDIPEDFGWRPESELELVAFKTYPR